MEAFVRSGARQALARRIQFSRRTKWKDVIPQAQGVADLINATNDGAAALALEKMSGTQNQLLADLAAKFGSLLFRGGGNRFCRSGSG